MSAPQSTPDSNIGDFSLCTVLKGDDHWYTSILLFFPMLIIVLLNAFNTIYVIIDYPAYLDHIHAFQTDPYASDFYNKYPAFYFIFMGVIGMLGFNTVLKIKLLFGLIDLLNVALIIKMVKLISPSSKKTPFYIGFLYFYFPIHLYFLKMGENDVVSIFFFIAAINFYLEKRFGRSAVMLSFAIMFKIFPIFFLIPITINFLKRRQLGKCLLYWILIGIMFLLLSLPYLVHDLQNNSMSYFEGVFVHTNRMSTGNSYSPAVGVFYETLFTIWFIDISALFLIQILALAFLFIYFYAQYKIPSNRDLIVMTFYTLFTITILMFQDNHTNFTRYLPFLLTILFTNLCIKLEDTKPLSVLMVYGGGLFLLQILLIYVLNNYSPFYSFYYLYYFVFVWAIWKVGGQEKKIAILIFCLLFITYEIAQKMENLYSFEPIPIIWVFFLFRTLVLLPMALILTQIGIQWFTRRNIPVLSS